jgi:hypothetical protein
VSLIDEALKRAQAAQGGEKRPEAAQRPWTPAPLPDPRRSRGRKTIRAAFLVAFTALASFGAFLLLRRAPDKTTAVLPAPTAPAALPEASSSAKATENGSPKDGGEKTAVNAPESRPTRAPRMAAATPVSPGPFSSVQGFPPATVAPDRPTALVDGKTYFGSITLPGGTRIELGGIVSSESNATALVNGKIVGAGAYVDGFTVIRIEEGRIELQGNGLTIFLALR